jgi:hypothetical protein
MFVGDYYKRREWRGVKQVSTIFSGPDFFDPAMRESKYHRPTSTPYPIDGVRNNKESKKLRLSRVECFDRSEGKKNSLRAYVKLIRWGILFYSPSSSAPAHL